MHTYTSFSYCTCIAEWSLAYIWTCTLLFHPRLLHACVILICCDVCNDIAIYRLLKGSPSTEVYMYTYAPDDKNYIWLYEEAIPFCMIWPWIKINSAPESNGPGVLPCLLVLYIYKLGVAHCSVFSALFTFHMHEVYYIIKKITWTVHSLIPHVHWKLFLQVVRWSASVGD